MLAFAEEPFEDKLYKYGPAPEFSRAEWTNVKFTLDLDFPNVSFVCGIYRLQMVATSNE